MTPNDIEILIHFHVSPSPYPRKEAPAVDNTINWLVRTFMIEPYIDGNGIGDPDSYRTTAKGAAHVRQLCALEWPSSAWVGKDGRVIE